MAKRKPIVVEPAREPERMIFLPTFFFGMFICAFGVFLALSVLTANITLDPEDAGETCITGLVGAWMAYRSEITFGVPGACFLIFMCFCWGARIMKQNTIFGTWPAVLGGLVMTVCASLFAGVFADENDILTGGLVSCYLLPVARQYFGGVGVGMAALVMFLIGAVLAFGAMVFTYAERMWFFGLGTTRLCLGITGWVTGGIAGRLRPKIVTAVSAAGQNALVPVSRLRETANRFTVIPGGVSATEAPGLQRAAATPATGRGLLGELFGAFGRWVRPAPAATTEAAEQPERGRKTRKVDAEPKASAVVAAPEPETAGEEDDGVEAVTAVVVEEPGVSRGELDEAEVEAVVAEETSRVREERAAANGLPVTEEAMADPATVSDVNAPSFSDEEIEDIQVTFDDEEDPAALAGLEELEAELPAAQNPYEKLAEQNARPTSSPTASAPAAGAATAGNAEDCGEAGEDPYAEDDEEEDYETAPAPAAPYELPPMDLLDAAPVSTGGNPAQLEKRARTLETTLAEFSIQGKVVHIERGPRITQFEMSLAPGIKLSRVSGLADNLAMALKAPSVRIIAPIPGRDTIGIEIPNIDQELVALIEIVEAVSREKRKQMLPLCLAKDVAGKPIVADLAKMPHLLIAGATGSGKSVCINSIIMSFLTCLTPQECKLIMVDPKVVELSRFRDIPHLMSPVITDMQKAVGVLEWACQEMDERYEKLSMVGVNNLAKFNAMPVDEIEQRVKSVYGEEELVVFPRRMPCIVIIIDELADLMMVAKKDVEHHIARLAAKSRAVGIHLILATQRPSTDVITGLIKANMPARIAFQVASKIDSRIILDQMGADALLGQGDMLYLPPGVGKVQRAQGVYVSDEELFRVVDYCKQQCRPQYHRELEGPIISGASNDGDVSEYDEFFLESARLIIESGRGSVSLLQRKLGIGYGRAARVIDQLAEAGVLGPFKEGKAREILLTMEDYEARFFGGVFGGAGGKGKPEGIAGQREDEKAPANLPWDE